MVTAQSQPVPEGRLYTEAEWDELLRAVLLQEVDKQGVEPEPVDQVSRLERTLLPAIEELRQEVAALRREIGALRAQRR